MMKWCPQIRNTLIHAPRSTQISGGFATFPYSSEMKPRSRVAVSDRTFDCFSLQNSAIERHTQQS
ncbi:hypothetical protein AGR4B_pAt10115 [Agrobacterium tumefaciens str. CFBP 5621]|nr:hypothetical protein AGR4B_pAt10115 [Agrobacterium tumefaciens str. CFBP 5621]